MENSAPDNENKLKWSANTRNKLRILYLLRYLMDHTDAEHPLSTIELTEMLEKEYDIPVSRNTISADLTMLQTVGLHVEHYRSKSNLWYYDGWAFNLPELKILIDAVLSSKFITQKKSEKLIEKLIAQTSTNYSGKLYRHVSPNERVKTDNEHGYYIVDAINEAIEAQRKISFYCTDYNSEKRRYVVNDGFAYVVSPYALIWDGDYYYVRGYCDDRQAMRNFRVDRILNRPTVLPQAAVPAPEDFSPADYSRSVFRMFDTDEPVEVDLYCHSTMMKYLFDNFGRDVQITSMEETEPEPAGETVIAADEEIQEELYFDIFKRSNEVAPEYFTARVTVCTSPTFFRWVFGFGGKIRIIGPEPVVEQYRDMLQRALEEYPACME